MDSMASWSHTAGTVRDGDGKVVRDGDGKVVRAGTENAARWTVGQPVRLESKVDLRVDGEGLEVSKRNAGVHMEKGASERTYPGLP